MSEEPAEQETGKPRRRGAGKPSGRAAASKVKSTIHLSVEASQRLDIHCTMMRMDRSELVEKLINEQLRRWVVSDRGKADSDSGEDAA